MTPQPNKAVTRKQIQLSKTKQRNDTQRTERRLDRKTVPAPPQDSHLNTYSDDQSSTTSIHQSRSKPDIGPGPTIGTSSALRQLDTQSVYLNGAALAETGRAESLLSRRLKSKIEEIACFTDVDDSSRSSSPVSARREARKTRAGEDYILQPVTSEGLIQGGVPYAEGTHRILATPQYSIYPPTYLTHQIPTMAGYPSGPPHHPSSHPGSSFHPTYPPYALPYHPYGSAPSMARADSVSTRDSPSDSPRTPPPTHAEPAVGVGEASDELLTRISSAIPDLHLLLSRYKETHGELGIREKLIRKAEAQQIEAMKRKEEHINSLMKQIEDLKKRHAGDINKYRLQIGDFEDKQRENDERLSELEASRNSLHVANQNLEAERTALLNERRLLAKTNADEIDRMKKAMETEKKKFAEEKVRLLTEFDEWKAAAKEAMVAEKKQMRKNFKVQLQGQQKVFAEEKAQMMEDFTKEKAQMVEDFTKEKESMNSDFLKQKLEAEESLRNANEELAEKLKRVQSDLDDACAKRDESQKALEEERTSFEKQLEEKVEEHKQSLAKEFEERRAEVLSQQETAMAALVQKHKDDLNDQTRAFVGLQETLNKRMTAENEELRKEIETLKQGWYEEKSKLESALAEAKSAAENPEGENG